jgi:hypothetical protein
MKAIRARSVRLIDPTYKNASGVVGRDIEASQVSSLRVFPDVQQARWDIGETAHMGVYSSFRAFDPEELDAWELGAEHKCETCGEPFATSQALGRHRLTHPPVVTDSTPATGTRPTQATPARRR